MSRLPILLALLCLFQAASALYAAFPENSNNAEPLGGFDEVKRFKRLVTWLSPNGTVLEFKNKQSCIYFSVHFIFKRFFKLGYFCEFLLSIFEEPNWTINFAYRIPSAYCPLLILVINALISFHRVTVVVFPMRSKMFWEDYTRHSLLISLLVPFIFMWFVIPCKGHAHIFQSGGIGFEYERIETFLGPLSASMFSAVAGAIFGSFTLICTIVIFITVRRKTMTTDKGMMIFEFLLTILTLIFAASQACLYFTSYYITDKAVKEFVEYNRIFFIDLFILPEAWTLLLCNKNVRGEVAVILGLKKTDETLLVTPNNIRKRSSIRPFELN